MKMMVCNEQFAFSVGLVILLVSRGLGSSSVRVFRLKYLVYRVFSTFATLTYVET